MVIGVKGYAFIIDDEEYDYFISKKWHVRLNRSGMPYMVSAKNERFHRTIMGKLNYNQQIDHIDGNTQDNRKCNLRICPRGMYNAINRGKQKNNTTGYKGVSLSRTIIKGRAYGYYTAHITYKQRKIFLSNSYSKNPEYAASVYDYAATLLFGEFAKLNNTGIEINQKDKLRIEEIVSKQTHEYVFKPKDKS